MPYRSNMAQDENEIARFAELLAAEGVRSYLEIGSKFGGSLWRVANALPKGSRIVSVDMPGGTRLWHQSEASLKACIAELRIGGYSADVIWGDSTAPATIAAVTRMGPFDACLLDGNHTMPFVMKDVANYGPLCRILAFHDIAWHRETDWAAANKKTPIDVPTWWNAHKDAYRHEEIRLCPSGKNNGIGALWRW